MTEIEPIHYRDHMRDVTGTAGSIGIAGQLRTGHLTAAHKMFRAPASHLDFNVDTLSRSDLAVNDLLDIASRAQTPTAIRADIKTIAERLRDQAAVLGFVAIMRHLSEENPQIPANHPLRQQSIETMTLDATHLRQLADFIERDADQAMTLRPPLPKRGTSIQRR